MAEDRVVIVTGAAHGIGLACARRFAANGCQVVLADHDAPAGREAAEELGEDTLFVQCDVGSRLAVHNLVAEALSAFGRIDVLVNNAGIRSGGDLLSQDEAEFDRVMAVNLKGPFLLSQAVARQMVEQVQTSQERQRDLRLRHAIVNVSSVEAQVAMADQLAYSVSEGALAQLTRAAALALAPYHIRVNAVAPGTVNTGMAGDIQDSRVALRRVLSRTPLGRLAEADEIAGVVSFLASPDASYITGEIIVADGGRMALNTTTALPDEA
jgi:NAD(P)-dependent dehydrogenase (short-subunit alcohol dehydrogenase family)